MKLLYFFVFYLLNKEVIGQNVLDIPDYNFPENENKDLNKMKIDIKHKTFRNANNYKERDKLLLMKFYELELIKNYQLNFTDWELVYREFDEIPISNQTQQIHNLKDKQKILERILIKLCEENCVNNFCDLMINDQSVSITPFNPESWSRFNNIEWREIPMKVKQMIILQLKIERYKTSRALSFMNSELCPYNKYFDEPKKQFIADINKNNENQEDKPNEET